MISSFFDDVNTLDCYTEYTFLFLDDDLIILIPWAIVTSLHHLHHCAEPLVSLYCPVGCLSVIPFISAINVISTGNATLE